MKVRVCYYERHHDTSVDQDIDMLKTRDYEATNFREERNLFWLGDKDGFVASFPLFSLAWVERIDDQPAGQPGTGDGTGMGN